MNRKCEICGSENNTDVFYVCACDENSPSAVLCQKCKEKYLKHIGTFSHSLPEIPFGWSYARYIESFIREETEKDDKKEETAMTVSYKGFTGELVKMERKMVPLMAPNLCSFSYDISIYDGEKQANISFTGVRLEDVKFLGGAVTFGQ